MSENQLRYTDSLISLNSVLNDDINSINLAFQDLDTILRIRRQSTECIFVETGIEIEYFQKESQFCSWRLVPECKESAGEKRLSPAEQLSYRISPEIIGRGDNFRLYALYMV